MKMIVAYFTAGGTLSSQSFSRAQKKKYAQLLRC